MALQREIAAADGIEEVESDGKLAAEKARVIAPGWRGCHGIAANQKTAPAGCPWSSRMMPLLGRDHLEGPGVIGRVLGTSLAHALSAIGRPQAPGSNQGTGTDGCSRTCARKFRGRQTPASSRRRGRVLAIDEGARSGRRIAPLCRFRAIQSTKKHALVLAFGRGDVARAQVAESARPRSDTGSRLLGSVDIHPVASAKEKCADAIDDDRLRRRAACWPRQIETREEVAQLAGGSACQRADHRRRDMGRAWRRSRLPA